MRKRKQRVLAFLGAALMICLIAVPALSATLAAMRLSKYMCTVNIASGNSLVSS